VPFDKGAALFLMPKKRPLTPSALAKITTLACDARNALLLFQSVAGGHFLATQNIPRGIQSLLTNLDGMIKELKETKSE
jgi:hypothetical protein